MPPARVISFLLSVLAFVLLSHYLVRVVGPLMASLRLGPKVELHPTANIPGWGGVFDPLGDCAIHGEGGVLRIEVPGTLHDLSVERAHLEAPRVLGEVMGDFVLEVTIRGPVHPHGNPTCSYALPYSGAGLLVWLDRDHYVRFERAAILRDGEPGGYLNFEQRTYANMTESIGTAVDDGPIRLRLERSGARVSASYQLEGEDWVPIKKSVAIHRWGDSLAAGVAAVNTASGPFLAEFRDFRIGR